MTFEQIIFSGPLLLLKKEGVKGGLCEASLTPFFPYPQSKLVSSLAGMAWIFSSLDCRLFEDGMKFSVIPHCVPRTWHIIAAQQMFASWITFILAALCTPSPGGPAAAAENRLGLFFPTSQGRRLLAYNHKVGSFSCSQGSFLQSLAR